MTFYSGLAIAVLNHKGGVGKTTSVLNIGSGLSAMGHKTLMIDLDPQANLTQSLKIDNPEYTIYGALRGDYALKPYTADRVLSIVPSTLDLSGAEIEFSSEAGREFLLREAIDNIRNHYSFILIDCPPSLGLLTINALTSADDILIPLQPEYLAVQGMSKILEVADKIKKRLNKNLNVKGIFITQYDSRKILHKTIIEMIQEKFRHLLFETKIRSNVSLAESPMQGEDIFSYNPSSKGAEDYKALCKEIVDKYELELVI